MHVKESTIEGDLIAKLGKLKYTVRPDIRDRAALERNFLDKFDALNRVYLTNNERARLFDDIVTADVFAASQRLRERSTFIRDDGTPLHYILVNTREWCKNRFEVVNQLRINTDNSQHRAGKGKRFGLLYAHNGVGKARLSMAFKNLGRKGEARGKVFDDFLAFYPFNRAKLPGKDALTC